MVVVEKKTSDLIPYENNPRHNDGAVEAVANSIKEFGFKVPIVIDSKNVIVAGHTRLKAAEKLGLKTVPCIIADDLTPEQVNAFRLADNKTGELAEWDYVLLEEELKNLQGIFEMQDFGFDDSEEVDIDDFFELKAQDAKEKEPEIIIAICDTPFLYIAKKIKD